MTSGKQSTVAILGCGYVGLTTAALLANCGLKVFAVEIDAKRLDVIRSGKSFFYEDGLDYLIGSDIGSGNLIPTSSYEESIPNSDIVFSCVGTPDNPDGSSNLTYVFESAKQAAELMRGGTIFVQKSTVPVGTGEKIKALFSELGKNLSYVSNPEFLREGTAIADSLWPDRIVAGSDSQGSAETVINLHRQIEQNADSLSKVAKIKKPQNIPKTKYVFVALGSAELIKVTANAFLAMKITFANSIAKLADSAGADVKEVMDAVGADSRIGRAFLNTGRGYGGGCFPKDVSGLIRSANDFGVGMEIMETVSDVNDSMPHYIVNKAEKEIGGSFSGKRVAVLGLAFKAGTSDTRRSPAITIADTLRQKGAIVKAYDPEAIEEALHYGLDEKIQLCNRLEDAVDSVDCIFVATDWQEFKDMDLRKIAESSVAKLIVDCMNCLDASAAKDASMKYVGVGRA